MAQFSGGAKMTGVGSTTLPAQSLYAASDRAPKLRRLKVTNTTTTATTFELVVLTTAGTQGADVTNKGSWDYSASVGPSSTIKQAHTVAPTIGERLGIFFTLGAAIGAADSEVFHGDGLRVPEGTANGFGLVQVDITGQLCMVSWYWDE